MNRDFYNYNYYPSNDYYTTSPISASYYNSGDRFIGGGFLAPFLLGGLAGAAIARPNYWGGGGYAPYPYPYPYNPYCCYR